MHIAKTIVIFKLQKTFSIFAVKKGDQTHDTNNSTRGRCHNITGFRKTLKLLKGVKVKTITELPNATTVKAIKDAKAGKVIRSKSSSEMFKSLSK